MKFSVPPVEYNSILKSASVFIISFNPSLLKTDIMAFFIFFYDSYTIKLLMQFYPNPLKFSRHLKLNKLIVDKLIILLRSF